MGSVNPAACCAKGDAVSCAQGPSVIQGAEGGARRRDKHGETGKGGNETGKQRTGRGHVDHDKKHKKHGAGTMGKSPRGLAASKNTSPAGNDEGGEGRGRAVPEGGAQTIIPSPRG